MNAIRAKGVTLIELMVALAILAVALTLGLPALDELLTRNRQTARLHQLQGDLHHARSHALTRRLRVEVCGSADGKTCQASWSQGWIARERRSQRLLLAHQQEADPTFQWSGFSASIQFMPSGTSPQSNGRFLQCHRQAVGWLLILNRQGRLRVGSTSENLAEVARCRGQ